MKLILLFVFSFLTFETWAACSSPISRTNNSPNTVLTSTKYNSDLNTVYTHTNDLNGDCLTDGTVDTLQLADESVTKAKLATGAVAKLQVSSYNTTANAGANDDVILLSGASFTLTLPVATGNSGKVYEIYHNGTSLTQVYTLQTTGGETIGGIAGGSYALYTNGEKLKIVSDGSNWQILDHKTESDWVSAGLITITATTTAPTKGTTSTDVIYWRRSGRFAEIDLQYSQTVAGTAGSGDYLFALPTGMTFDATFAPVETGGTAQSNTVFYSSNPAFIQKLLTGEGSMIVTGANYTWMGSLGLMPYATNTFRVYWGNWSGAGPYIPWGSTYGGLNNAGVHVRLTVKIPISGWRP